jgi:hypothetical protein
MHKLALSHLVICQCIDAPAADEFTSAFGHGGAAQVDSSLANQLTRAVAIS